MGSAWFDPPPLLKGGDGKSEKWPFPGGYKISRIKGWDGEKGGDLLKKGGMEHFSSKICVG